mmetsp:Transcript_30061/g.75676  ORF Transcript_30061/g.75676 Transcript_30061/m.75676 type:complete len:338 (-) Transcript_30061:1289-2302(-)
MASEAHAGAPLGATAPIPSSPWWWCPSSAAAPLPGPSAWWKSTSASGLSSPWPCRGPAPAPAPAEPPWGGCSEAPSPLWSLIMRARRSIVDILASDRDPKHRFSRLQASTKVRRLAVRLVAKLGVSSSRSAGAGWAGSWSDATQNLSLNEMIFWNSLTSTSERCPPWMERESCERMVEKACSSARSDDGRTEGGNSAILERCELRSKPWTSPLVCAVSRRRRYQCAMRTVASRRTLRERAVKTWWLSAEGGGTRRWMCEKPWLRTYSMYPMRMPVSSFWRSSDLSLPWMGIESMHSISTLPRVSADDSGPNSCTYMPSSITSPCASSCWNAKMLLTR